MQIVLSRLFLTCTFKNQNLRENLKKFSTLKLSELTFSNSAVKPATKRRGGKKAWI